MITTDPLLNEEALQITDLASARYALKIASDNYFGVFHMFEQAQRELARSAAENKAQKLALIEPYVLKQFNPITLQPIPLTEVPEPLPAAVPLAVRDALNWFDEQLELEQKRAFAEIEQESLTLKETISQLEEMAAAWFKGEIGKTWLNGRTSVTISGVTVSLSGFEYAELDYGE